MVDLAVTKYNELLTSILNPDPLTPLSNLIKTENHNWSSGIARILINFK